MYHKYGIQQLSESQIGKALRNLPVTIKAGAHHIVNLTQEQIKKDQREHLKGSGVRITFDPYQVQMHRHLVGSGIMDKLKKGAKSLASKAKSIYKANEAQLSPYVAQAKDYAHSQIGNLASQYGSKLGSFAPMVEQYAHSALDSGVEQALAGEGVRRQRRKRGGKINLRQIGNKILSGAKSIAKSPMGRQLINQGIQMGLQTASAMSGQPELMMASPMIHAGVNQMLGEGIHRRKRVSRKHSGGALYPPHGGSLYY
jgi:hypothetical protein